MGTIMVLKFIQSVFGKTVFLQQVATSKQS